MRHRARERGVVVRIGLRASPDKIEGEFLTLFCHRAEELLRHGFPSLSVEGRHILPCHPGAIRHRSQFGSGLLLGILDHLLSGRLHEVGPEFIHQS